MPSHRAVFVVIAALALPIAACTPHTDIVATSMEDVGRYDFDAARTQDGLTATVCVDLPRESDTIVSRLVQQLANHEYRSLTFDVFSFAGPVGRWVWTPAGSRREGAAQTTSPCADIRRKHLSETTNHS